MRHADLALYTYILIIFNIHRVNPNSLKSSPKFECIFDTIHTPKTMISLNKYFYSYFSDFLFIIIYFSCIFFNAQKSLLTFTGISGNFTLSFTI